MRKTKKSFFLVMVSLGLLFFQGLVWAASTGDLITISGTLVNNVSAVAKLLIMVSYAAGISFALAGVVQFKAHKDNPTQVPLSKPIVFLIVGACLLYLPTLISSAGSTIFGGTQQTAATATVIN